MYGRPRRHLSQASYRLLQEIRQENDRQKQIDAGLMYRRHATRVVRDEERPLHIGPELDLTRNEYSAA